MRLVSVGEPPAPPFLLVSNHLGYVDVLAFAATTGCIFVAKSDVARWPVVGSLCKATDTIFVDRGNRRDVRRVDALVEAAIRRGDGVVLFPEGTSTPGATVGDFKSSLLEYPVRSGLAVHSAAITYLTVAPAPPAHLSVCWWGEMTFPSHFLALLGMRGFEVRITYGGEPVVSDDRKMLARVLRERILQDFDPVVSFDVDGGTGGREGSREHVHGDVAS
jgi:1-acyl-sn-glycerol-3-phosphate acyltransferase